MEPKGIDQLFWDAAQIAVPDERKAYLDRACAGDPGLRRKLERLLEARARAERFLESPACGRVAADSPVRERAGTDIGPYRLLEQIGEGGMGLVFVAEQTEPVRRQVALKVIKPGMDSKQVIARFEAERQALALMDHPNIARVLDAGTTDSGRPYFVMELIKGVPLTAFCDLRRLTPRQRLELFVPVCSAVQHAHQKGIIHRDLKPSNVLVALHDGTPVVKVIDFGVAKAVGQQLTEKTVYTGFFQMLGTPLYMSPEQVGMSSQDIDTRTDIYALGVLLYQLLTGTTPFEGERFEQASFNEIRWIIREEEPPRPSTRFSTLAEAVATVSANRQSDPGKMSQLLRGELDWIVMKCLEKDRNRRYESANDLALDIRRYLNDEPVLAGPPSAGYRLRKFVRRHRRPALAAALVLLMLLAGLAGTTLGLVRAERARAAEADARKDAEANEQRARDERDRAEEERQIAEAVRRFLLFDLLRQADPHTRAETLRLAGGGHEVHENPTVKELLDRAAAELTADRIEAKFPGQPRVQAEVLQTIGLTYQGVGEYDQAIAHLARSRDRMAQALGGEHRETLVTLHNLAAAYRLAGKTAEAIELFEQVRKARVARPGPNDPETLATLNNLAGAFREVGHLEDAITLFEQVRETRSTVLGPTHRDTLTTMHNLAWTYRQAGRMPEAIALLEEVRVARVDRLGPKDPNTLSTLDSLAGVYREVGKTAEAIELYESVHRTRAAVLSPKHPDTLTTANNLATAYWSAGQFDRSVPLFEETLRHSEAGLPPDHPATLVTLANLGINYRDAGRQADGIARLKEALARAQKRPGPLPPQLAWIARALAETYDRGGQFARSEPLYKEFVAEAQRKYGEDSPEVTGPLNRLGLNLLRQGKGARAAPILRKSLDLCDRHVPASWMAYETRVLLGGAHLRQQQYSEAEPLLRAGYEGLKRLGARVPPTDRGRLRDALDGLIEVAGARGDTATAEKWRKERKALGL